MSYPPLAEISGIAKSATYPDVYWVHNDSGDSARLFAIHADGSVIVPAPWQPDLRTRTAQWPGLQITGASNVDWEAVTLAHGRLYVADMGNNANARRDLGIYVIDEPDPAVAVSVRAVQFIPVRYPEQDRWPAAVWHFDCEAVFRDGGKLYFITKHRKAGQITGWEAGARLYRLDTAHTDEQNTLTFLSARNDIMLATDAALSPDGGSLAVLTYQIVYVFARPQAGDDWFSSVPRRFTLPLLRTGQAEGITWMDGATVLIASENRRLFRLHIGPVGTVTRRGPRSFSRIRPRPRRDIKEQT